MSEDIHRPREASTVTIGSNDSDTLERRLRARPRRKSTMMESIAKGGLYGVHEARTTLREVVEKKRMETIASLSEETPLLGTTDTSSPEEDAFDDTRSTLIQSIFNATNILMGLAVLAFPYAMSLAGWIPGTIILVSLCFLTYWTGTIVAKNMAYKPGINTYSEMATAALGQKVGFPITILFLLEIFAACVSIVIVMADSLHVIFSKIPSLHESWWIHPTPLKIILMSLLTPVTFSNNLSWLSYGSLLGILSVINLVAIVCFDGWYRKVAPGSLWDPSPTHLFPVGRGWMALPLTQGIFMSGFAGHAVFPNLIADMEDRSKFPIVLAVAYFAVVLLSLGVSVVGYLMFGSGTLKEITMNLADASLGYPPEVNQFTIALMGVNAITKYPLTVGGVNLNLESLLVSLGWLSDGRLKRILLRTIVAVMVLLVSIVFPDIHKVLALLGSFFSFLVCVIIPCTCYLKLYGQDMTPSQRIAMKAVIGLASILAMLGTIWTFLPKNVTGVE